VASIYAALTLSILTLTTGIASAQSATGVTITVTDQSGGAVPGASITLTKANENKTFTADSKGLVQVPELSTGEWILYARGEGFAVRERPLVYSGVAQNISVVLDVAPVKQTILVEAPKDIPSAVQLNASAAGGSYLDVPIKDLPFNFTVITQDYIRERGVTNLLDSLELVSGVTTWADSGYIPAVDIRGLSTTDAGIFMAFDGVVPNSVPQAVRNMDSFFIDRVEVLKGPSSFSYGSGVAGASINTRMKTPRRELAMDSMLTYGSFGNTRVGFGITGPLTKNLAGRIDLVNSHGGTNIQRSDLTNRGVNTGLVWTPIERVTVTASGNYTMDNLSPYFSTPLLNSKPDPNVNYVEIAANTFVDPRARTVNYNMTDPRNKSITRRGTLTTDIDLSHGWQLQHKIYGIQMRLDAINSEGGAFNQTTLLFTPGSAPGGTYFFNFKRDWLVGNTVSIRNTFRFWEGHPISFTAGGTVERNNQGRYGADPAFGSTGAAPSMDYLNPVAHAPLHEHFIRVRNVDTDYDTGYFEGSFRLLKKLSLSGGARLDHITNSRLTFATSTAPEAINTVSFHPVTGRYALTYDLTPTVTLYVGRSTAIQPTGTANNNTGATALVNITQTQAQFVLQRTRSWEGGVKASAWRERVQGTVSLFNMRKYDILTQELIDGVLFVERTGKVESRGIDTSFMVSPIRRFSLQTDFVWNDAKYLVFNTVANGVEVDRSGNKQARAPAVLWTVTPIVRLGPVTGSISFRTRGPSWNDSNNTQRLQQQTIINSNISINMAKGFKAVLTARNLTDELIYNRGGIAAGATTGRIGLPRNYSMQITRNF